MPVDVFRPCQVRLLATVLAALAPVVQAQSVQAPPAHEPRASETMRSTLVNGVMVLYREAARREMINGVEVRIGVPVPAALMEERRQRLAVLLNLPVEDVTLVRQMSSGAHLFRFARPTEAASLTPRLVGGDAEIETVSPNGRVQPAIVTSAQVKREPFFPLQWNLQAIQLRPALSQADGTGVVVAVLDSGKVDHPELKGQWLPGRDFISAADGHDGDGWDDDATDVPHRLGGSVDRSPWHGLSVAGLLAAKLDRAGMLGVAPGARLLPLRVLEGGGGEEADVIEAIRWAAGGDVPGIPVNPTPAKVLNLSFGSTKACSAEYQAAFDFAIAQGVVSVAAAGNEASETSDHAPSNCSGVISVGASTRGGKRANYSNRDADLVAPGGADARPGYSNVLTTYNAGIRAAHSPSYEFKDGTSFATPQVAGVVALMLQLRPTATPGQIKQALLAGAKPLPDCDRCGAGLLNAPGALDRIRELVDTGVIANP